MKLYSYKYLRDTSYKPKTQHLLYEHTDGVIYMVISANPGYILKSTDKGVNWSWAYIITPLIISAIYPDKTNDKLYFCADSNTTSFYRHIVLSTGGLGTRHDFENGTEQISYDVFVYNNYPYLFTSAKKVDNHTWLFLCTWNPNYNVYSKDMGAFAGRTWDATPICLIGDEVWFLWQWSNENVELWKYDIGDDIWTEMEDCGANTELAPVKQKAIAYNGSDILYFILKDTSNSKYYLYTYVISTDTLTKGVEYNIALMLDRMTYSASVYEKGFHITNPYVYQIHKDYKYLFKIGKTDTGDTIISITDNFAFIESA